MELVTKNVYQKAYTWLLSIHILVFICLVSFIDITTSTFFSHLIGFKNPFPIYGYYNVPRHFLTAIILSPVTETLVFQYGIIKLVQRLKWGNMPAILISATLFGLLHYFSFKYIAFAFWGGFIYAGSFVLLQQRKEKAFLWVYIMHAMYNMYIMSSMLLPYWLHPDKTTIQPDWWF